MTVVDAFTFLRADHESVLGMFESLEGARPGGEAANSAVQTMVTNLIVAESQHEAIEEQFFWPAVRKALDDGDELADRAIEQEDEGKQLLQKLENGDPSAVHYYQVLTEFIVAARKHIAYEQDVVWPRVGAVMDAGQLEELGEKLKKAKPAAPTRPHPNTPSNPMVQKTMGVMASALDHARDAVTGRTKDHPPQAPPS